jgi:hypothetical protein
LNNKILQEYELAMSSFDIQSNFLDSSKIGIKVEEILVPDEVIVKEVRTDIHNIYIDHSLA